MRAWILEEFNAEAEFRVAARKQNRSSRGASLLWPGTAWSVKSGNLLADNWILWRFINIDLRPVRIILGHVGVGENSFHRTLRHTGVAIDASIRIDVKAVCQFMKRLHRTNGCTIGVLAINT